MKRRWLITNVALCILAAATVLVVKQAAPVLPAAQCSNVYRQFIGHRDIKASYVKDFLFDSTLCLSVTILQATTDSAWFAMGQELHIPQKSMKLDDGSGSVSLGILWVDRETLRPNVNVPIEERYHRIIVRRTRQLFFVEEANEYQGHVVLSHFIKQLKYSTNTEN